jgi:hypothetical protein
MADGSLAGDLAQAIDHIVAGHAGRFVDDEKPVHYFTLSDQAS